MQLDRLSQEINQADNQLVQLRANIGASEQRIEAAGRRIDEQRVLQTSISERLGTDRVRLDENRVELETVQQSAHQLQEETHGLHAKIDELNAQDAELARNLTQAQAILEDEKAGIIDLLRKSAQTHNEIVRLNTHRESLIGQKGRLSQRDAQIRVELESSLERKAQLERRLLEVEALLAEETRRLEEKKTEAAKTNAVRQALVDELARDKERRSALQSRRDLLSDLQNKMDGVRAGVRQVLATAKKENESGRYAHIAGLLADIFETDVAHARVIEAALGDWDQHLVLTNSDEVLCDPSMFAKLPGRLTAICEDRIPPLLNSASQTDFSQQPGFVARAIDLVRFAEKFERLARHLFSKTIIVDSLDTARRMARADALNHRFVTLAGEVVEADGRVSLGPAASEAGLISRKSELREIHRELTELDGRIVSLTDRLNRTEAEISHLELVQQELRTAIYEASTAKVTANAALQNIRETVHRLTQEQPLILGEVSLLEQQINEVLDKAAQGGQSLEELECENKKREEQVGAHQERIDAIVASRRESQEELTRAKVAAGQLTEKRAAAAHTINTLRRAIHELEASVASADSDIEQCAARIADAEQAIAQGREQLAELARQRETLEATAARLRDQRETLRSRLDELSQIVKTARHRLSAAEAGLHELEMARSTTNVRRDELVVRIIEEMGINLAERYQNYEHAEQDWEQVTAEIADLRGKMERLGNVNLDAISELEEIEKRHAFLTGQRDDLTEAHRQLQELITSLNQESQQRFMTAFDQITENFRALFRKLFGGGRADIILEDRENVLDCGIEIVAQPPGKELQAISLMSGGEKSMTAIALLMSIFKTRPAPFAILDEVDAALDEANNHRFNRIVEEFVNEAQFIIITHSKRTMNIGDRLYGITMQEPGVSTRVSVQLAQANVA